MSKWLRAFLIFFTFLMAVLSLILLLMFLSDAVMNDIVFALSRLSHSRISRNIAVLLLSACFVISLLALSVSLLSARLRRARVRANSIGAIDIGVDAIESIALNAAKGSQSGVKAAKARISPDKADKIKVHLNVMTYSDVELPAMMSKVQERVKKDIERFTGIEVASVTVKVSKVDAIAARVEH